MKELFSHLIIFFSITTACAQDWSGKVYTTGQIYPGYYVSNTNDTVQGYFLHGNQVSNQKKCYFYKNETDREPTFAFSPHDIKSFKVADKLYRTVPYSGGLIASPLRFLLVTKDGGIAELVFYSEDGAATSESVFYKPHDPANSKPVTLPYFGLGFAKKLSQYLSDYPELAKKVADKEKGYGMLKLLDIIAEYNTWYATKAK